MRAADVLLAAAILSLTAAFPASLRAQDARDPLRLLDVPYLPQTPALCGGAAAAMVMRYWGTVDIYADAFAHLVDPVAGGIRGDDLLQAVRARGWEAHAFRGDAAAVQSHLASRRPVVALIEDRPGRFHYVVVVGWARGRVIAHDPARAPFRVYDEPAFHDAWARSQFWSLLALPGRPIPTSEPVSVSGPLATAGTSCTSMTAEAVRLAGAGQLDDSRRLLELITESCPRDPAPWRELAGLHALRREWRSAAVLAREALSRSADDAHAARILATSLFLQDDPDGALGAWNGLGEPTIDLVTVTGLERTRYDVVATALRLEPRTVLSQSDLQAARRRVSELPAALSTRVSYTPVEQGRATVDVSVVERPLIPSGTIPLTAMMLRGLSDRELSASVASPTGGGEVIAGSWRWWEHRPRAAIAISTPSPSSRLGTVWRADVFGERQTYDAGGQLEEHRRGAAFSVIDWASPALRWEVSLGVDRWAEHGAALSVGAAVERWSAGDRFALRVRGSLWRGDVNTAAAAVQADWRSATRREGHVWHARAGVDVVESSAPLALWTGAGTGHGRDVLLRGHPLLDGGVVRNAVFGRTLAHAGAEWRRWAQPRRLPLRVAPALFVDIARAQRGLIGFDGRLHLDAGTGVRVAFPGTGVLRVDVARGLRDGEMALSFGWTR